MLKLKLVFKSNKRLILKSFYENKNLITGIITIGLFTTIMFVAYYYSVHQLSLSNQVLNQKSKVNSLIQKIQNYTAISGQIGRTLENHVVDIKLNKSEVEVFLKKVLNSGPSNLIYGVGIWYEPNLFQNNIKLFGPYVHRDISNKNKTILTYEWNTPEYNYPSQDWYKNSISRKNTGIYIEPYFDAGLVYVTYSRPFYDKNDQFNGVITVDMILPQLQDLVNEVNVDNAEIIYIESRNGFLLGHPLEKIFLENVKSTGKESLIEYKIDDFNKLLNIKKSNDQVLKNHDIIPELEWKVVIESEKTYILKDSYRLAKVIFFGLTLLWICIFSFLYFAIRSRKQKLENELKIKEHQTQLVNASRLATLGEFVSGIAHEVNNPLAIVSAKTEKLLKSIKNGIYDPEIFQNELSKIYENSGRIAKIVRGLKAVSRDMEADPFLRTSLNQVFVDTFAICADQLKGKNITLRIIPFFDVHIDCRQNQISQVLLNLVTNSIDAIELQSHPWIQVEVKISNDLRILFTDSGEGIPADVARKIMQPFYTTKAVNKGTGLGLSISCDIIKVHNGELTYNSNSKNTQFEIRLPLSKV